MKLCPDKKVLKAIDRWEDEAVNMAAVGVAVDTMHAPEMTPIEQIVYFMLRYREETRREKFKIHPQYKIGKYRVDFLIVKKHNTAPHCELIAIECDGHDFHERTKEQAQRDKQRDRNLQKAGVKVYRFTGSEIWQTDGQCVLDSLGMSEQEGDYNE